MTFATKLPKPGRYEVRIAYTPSSNRATNAPATVHHSQGTTVIEVNQQKTPPLARSWVSLGKFTFSTDAKVVLSNTNANGLVIVDAVQLLP